MCRIKIGVRIPLLLFFQHSCSELCSNMIFFAIEATAINLRTWNKKLARNINSS